MQFITKTFVRILIFVCPFLSIAQSTYLPQSSKHQQFLERLEILLQNNSDLNVATAKPLSRRIAVRVGELADSIDKTSGNLLSDIDRHNLRSLLMNNSEWVTGDRSDFASTKSIWNTFYKSKANLLEVNEKDIFLAVNPVIQQQQSIEGNNSDRIFLNNKGLSFRGMISRRIGFSGYITDNQERAPQFVQQLINDRVAVPGAGYYQKFKNTAVDYFDARGSVHFTAARYLDFQFGFDKNFIGNGYRSLFLSDFGSSYLFLKINTRIWKLNYQNLFMELTPQFDENPGNKILDNKYASIHHLSINATRWLTLGVFEAIIFGRKNRFAFSYLNPVIFLRAAEGQNGSGDNALVGFDFKANVAKAFQFYGQLLIDEFKLKELRAGDGWWGNKFGMQLGGKYINVFRVRNLDLQGEINFVRPFTYTHFDTVVNYTHYNQPMAHPLGTNFFEAIGIIRYQPHRKWNTSLRLIAWKQGVDTGSANYGVNIFKTSNTRTGSFGFGLPSGVPATGVNTQFLVTYEVKENLFLDLSILVRKWRVENIISMNRNTNVFTAGIRLNVFRREYDY